jgi:heme-degrading monooxygenase HmoA
MIERHWKGVAKREKAKEYVEHLQNDTFKQLTNINGFISAKILERDLDKGIEFLIITVWESVDAIKQFSGSNIEMAVVPEQVHEMMLTYGNTVQHYKINFETARL